MLDGRSNAYVEAMNGLLQQTNRAARGFRTVANFIAIAYLRMARLKHQPTNPLRAAVPLNFCVTRHGRLKSNSPRNGIEPLFVPTTGEAISRYLYWRVFT